MTEKCCLSEEENEKEEGDVRRQSHGLGRGSRKIKIRME